MQGGCFNVRILDLSTNPTHSEWDSAYTPYYIIPATKPPLLTVAYVPWVKPILYLPLPPMTTISSLYYYEDIGYKDEVEPGKISIEFSPDVALDGFDPSVGIDEPFLIWDDNRAAIDYAKKSSNSKRIIMYYASNSKRTRHLDKRLKKRLGLGRK